MKQATMSWSQMDQVFDNIGKHLKSLAKLCVIGSTVSMSQGQCDRLTIDIDVWRRRSDFDQADLKQACEAAGVFFNPVGYDEPDGVYMQMVDTGIVQLGEFKSTIPLSKTGNLEISHPPIENIIASKMVRGEEQDYEDSAFLCKKNAINLNDVVRVIDTMKDETSAEIAKENLSLLQAYVGYKPAPEAKKDRSSSCSM